MKIKILGTKGEIKSSAPYHSHKSGILIDNKILIDLGEEEFLKNKPELILITHLHPDHAFFIRKKKPLPKIKAPLYIPEPYKETDIKIASKKILYGPYTIIPIPTEHSLKVKSQAYLITKGNEKILYTGDLFWIKKEYHKHLKNLNLVITDGSFINKGGLIRRNTSTNKAYGHAGIPNLIKLFKDHTKNIVFVHFGSWFFNKGARNARKIIDQLAKQYGIHIIVGYDGMIINTKNLR